MACLLFMFLSSCLFLGGTCPQPLCLLMWSVLGMPPPVARERGEGLHGQLASSETAPGSARWGGAFGEQKVRAGGRQQEGDGGKGCYAGSWPPSTSILLLPCVWEGADSQARLRRGGLHCSCPPPPGRPCPATTVPRQCGCASLPAHGCSWGVGRSCPKVKGKRLGVRRGERATGRQMGQCQQSANSQR